MLPPHGGNISGEAVRWERHKLIESGLVDTNWEDCNCGVGRNDREKKNMRSSERKRDGNHIRPRALAMQLGWFGNGVS